MYSAVSCDISLHSLRHPLASFFLFCPSMVLKEATSDVKLIEIVMASSMWLVMSIIIIKLKKQGIGKIISKIQFWLPSFNSIKINASWSEYILTLTLFSWQHYQNPMLGDLAVRFKCSLQLSGATSRSTKSPVCKRSKSGPAEIYIFQFSASYWIIYM